MIDRPVAGAAATRDGSPKRVLQLTSLEREINAAVSRFDAGGDWTSSLSPADLVLSPAACYPVYPIAASRGQLPKGGLRFDVAADCFRR